MQRPEQETAGRQIVEHARPTHPVSMPPPRRKGWKWTIFGALAIVGFLMILGAGRRNQSSQQAPQSEALPPNGTPEGLQAGASAQQAIPAASGPRVVTVSLDDYCRDYSANELRADDKYKGALLVTAGRVTAFGSTFGTVSLTLLGDRGRCKVHATLDATQRAAATRLNKGDVVQLTCTGAGFLLGPIMSACVLR